MKKKMSNYSAIIAGLLIVVLILLINRDQYYLTYRW